MTERSVTHATFVLERVYASSPARVFAAWADSELKARWFGGPEEWGPDEFESDFRVGGREVSRGGPKDGPTHTYQGLYQDIVPDERIVLTYDMHLDDVRISVSLATVEFNAAGGGSRLTYTEQGAFLDGFDNPAEREHGMGVLLDQLGAELASQ